jgi:NAD(P)-dependent dehydrogenase (short-subunit alcohol dehydrogenase family)
LIRDVDLMADGMCGVIINVSSIAAADSRSSTSYAASKGAVDGIALSLYVSTAGASA